jgi:hypothetical protein
MHACWLKLIPLFAAWNGTLPLRGGVTQVENARIAA